MRLKIQMRRALHCCRMDATKQKKWRPTAVIRSWVVACCRRQNCHNMIARFMHSVCAFRGGGGDNKTGKTQTLIVQQA